MKSEQSVSDKVIQLFPYLLILVALLGISLVAYLGRLDLAVMSLILIIPILLVAGLLLYRRNQTSAVEYPGFVSRISFFNLVLLYVLTMIISVILLIFYLERPLAYFIVIALTTGILFLQIMTRRDSWTEYLIIFEMALLSLNLIWGLGLKYPLYFGGTDIMGHLAFIESILNTNHITELGAQYRYFPGYHIFIAIGSEITGLHIKDAMFVFVGLAWQAGLLFAYLIFHRFSNSSRIALIACLVFAVNEAAIYYGSYSVARTLDFVLFLGWFYIALNLFKKDVMYIPLLLIITAALILTHHLTTILLTPVLVVFYICQKIFFGFRKEHPLLPLAPLIFLSVTFFGYFIWVSSELFGSVLPAYMASIFTTEMELAVDPGQLAGSPLAYVFNSAYYALVLIFALFGISFAWNAGREKTIRNTLRTLALAALLFLVLFLPYPLGFLPQARLTLADRYPLLVLPFISIIMAYGINYLVCLRRRSETQTGLASRIPAFTTGLVLIAAFFSIISGINARDSNVFPNSAEAPTTYFSSSEVDSFTFMDQKGNPALALYSDYFTVRNSYNLEKFPYRHVLKEANINYIEEGYVILRVEELQEKDGLSFSHSGDTFQLYRYKIDSLNSENDIQTSLNNKDNIYSNGKVRLFLIINDRDSLAQGNNPS